MTPEQEDELIKWITAITRAVYNSGDHVFQHELVVRHREICVAFGHTHTDFMGNPVRPPSARGVYDDQ